MKTVSLPILRESHRRRFADITGVIAAKNRPHGGTEVSVTGLSSTLTTAAAMSSGSTGFWAADVWVPVINSVLVNVGITQLTSTPCGANSSDSPLDRPTTPNLVPA